MKCLYTPHFFEGDPNHKPFSFTSLFREIKLSSIKGKTLASASTHPLTSPWRAPSPPASRRRRRQRRQRRRRQRRQRRRRQRRAAAAAALRAHSLPRSHAPPPHPPPPASAPPARSRAPGRSYITHTHTHTYIYIITNRERDERLDERVKARERDWKAGGRLVEGRWNAGGRQAGGRPVEGSRASRCGRRHARYVA